MVRLKPLDDCLCGARDVLDLGPTATPRRFSLAVSSPPELGAAVEDREFGSFDDLRRKTPLGVRDNELKGQVVEGGSVVVDAVADEDAPIWWWPADILDPENPPALRVLLCAETVVTWFGEKLVDGLAERVKTLFCPFEL